jgi:hypothetical protein
MTLHNHKQIEEALSKARLASDGYEFVFEPIPHSSQEIALDSRCHHTLYCGTRGPGKTITQLMRFRRHVGKGYGSYWRGVILDCEFKNLADLVAQSKRFFLKFGDGAKFLSGGSEYKWVWPTGEELLFRHAKRVSDYDNFHGHEYPFIGWNELTKHPTGDLYDKFMSTNRSSFDPTKDTPKRIGHNGGPKLDADDVYDTPDGKPLPPIPLEVFSTTNPNGPGHHWVKRRFIAPAPYGQVVRTYADVFNPQTQQEETIEKTQVAIFGSYRENVYLPPEYVAELDAIKDPNLRAAWLLGSWDVNAGGAFDDLWDTKVHVIPRFTIPETWHVNRAFDWGSSEPFSVGWYAEANGEEVELPDGRTFAPAAGSIIMIAEWYGAQADQKTGERVGTNKGLRMSAKDVARGIKDREIVMMTNGWILRQPSPGPADNQINNVNEKESDSIGIKMAKEGVRWTKSDKTKGSRFNGFQLFRDRLGAAVKKEGPAFYVMINCQDAIEVIPTLPRDEKDPDDVDTDAPDDHIYDQVRYRVLAASNRYARKLNLTMPT